MGIVRIFLFGHLSEQTEWPNQNKLAYKMVLLPIFFTIMWIDLWVGKKDSQDKTIQSKICSPRQTRTKRWNWCEKTSHRVHKDLLPEVQCKQSKANESIKCQSFPIFTHHEDFFRFCFFVRHGQGSVVVDAHVSFLWRFVLRASTSDNTPDDGPHVRTNGCLRL